ncbi:MAG: thioredoxin family protein [Bacteroidota bacterium]
MPVSKPEIKLLCPPKKCGKCRRMIRRVESILEQMDIKEKIQIVNDPDKLLQYPTWVLPTLLINGKVVARGYLPSSDAVREVLEKE